MPLKYNLLQLLRSLFEKRKPAFIIQNIALLIKIDNDEAVFLPSSDVMMEDPLKLKHSWQSRHCFAAEC